MPSICRSSFSRYCWRSQESHRCRGLCPDCCGRRICRSDTHDQLVTRQPRQRPSSTSEEFATIPAAPCGLSWANSSSPGRKFEGPYDKCRPTRPTPSVTLWTTPHITPSDRVANTERAYRRSISRWCRGRWPPGSGIGVDPRIEASLRRSAPEPTHRIGHTKWCGPGRGTPTVRFRQATTQVAVAGRRCHRQVPRTGPAAAAAAPDRLGRLTRAAGTEGVTLRAPKVGSRGARPQAGKPERPRPRPSGAPAPPLTGADVTEMSDYLPTELSRTESKPVSLK